MKKAVVSRRTMLKGLGTAIALPWLEQMNLLAAPASTTAAGNHPILRGVSLCAQRRSHAELDSHRFGNGF